MFGLAVNTSYLVGVNMYLPQIIYFTSFALVLAAFGTYLTLRRPPGPLPASFGHIQTIADVIDEWADSGCMFWGHKMEGDSPTDRCYAGTRTMQLKLPVQDRWYGGLEIANPPEWRLPGEPISVNEENVASSAISIYLETGEHFRYMPPSGSGLNGASSPHGSVLSARSTS